MNGIFGFAIYDGKDEYLPCIMDYSIIHWLGSTWNFYGSEFESIGRLLHKNSIVSRHI
jgi:hypothetical protein